MGSIFRRTLFLGTEFSRGPTIPSAGKALLNALTWVSVYQRAGTSRAFLWHLGPTVFNLWDWVQAVPFPHSAVRAACQPILWAWTYYALHCRETVRRFQWILRGSAERSKVEEVAPSALPWGVERDSKDSTFWLFPKLCLHPGCP